MSKKIGIVGWKTGDNSFGITVPYMEYFSKYGSVHVLGANDDIQTDLDLLVLPGGRDINPLKYITEGESISMRVGYGDPFLEQFDDRCLSKYIQAGVPVYGICRGLQAINVFFGGTLYQHLGGLHPFISDPDDRGEIVHDIRYELEGETFTEGVNSLHHQAIKDLGEGLKVIARTHFKLKKGEKPVHERYHIIEAIQHENLPIFAVQYHPEELINNKLANTMLKKLLTVKEEVHG